MEHPLGMAGGCSLLTKRGTNISCQARNLGSGQEERAFTYLSVYSLTLAVPGEGRVQKLPQWVAPILSLCHSNVYPLLGDTYSFTSASHSAEAVVLLGWDFFTSPSSAQPFRHPQMKH